jgi:eukaryotic-like serine/threonine-protein kinase
MLYEIASGQLPFTADNFMGILTQHMYKAPTPPRMLIPEPDCPPWLEAIILKCMSKKAEARYDSMAELADDLQRARDGVQPLAVAELMARSGGFNVPADYFKTPQPAAIVPATPSVPQKKWPRFVWLAGASAAVAIVTMIFVISSIVNSGQQTKQAAPEASSVAVIIPPPPPTQPAPTAAQPAAPGPKKVTVALTAVPKTASGFLGEKEIKLPASIEVEEGKPVIIEVRENGYEPMKVELDGKEMIKQVELKKKKAGATAPQGTGDPGSNRLIDPWDPSNKPRRK